MRHKILLRSALIFLGVLALAVVLYVMGQSGDRDVSAGAEPTSTSTVAPTKQPDPGDTDGDGCTDQQENGPNRLFGGSRDYLNPWDYFDPTGDGFIRMDDVLGVIEHYSPEGTEPEYDVNYDIGPTGTEPEYDVNFDRGPSTGPDPWNMTAPDGVIDLSNDIMGVIQQYQHDCS